jgi:hypothetical protein
MTAKALVAGIDSNDDLEQCLERIRVALGADDPDELGVAFAPSSKPARSNSDAVRQ